MPPLQVFNITPYLKFHPGGADILVKVAGKDGTALFNKYHPWVNVRALIGKCLVGRLAQTDQKESAEPASIEAAVEEGSDSERAGRLGTQAEPAGCLEDEPAAEDGGSEQQQRPWGLAGERPDLQQPQIALAEAPAGDASRGPSGLNGPAA